MISPVPVMLRLDASVTRSDRGLACPARSGFPDLMAETPKPPVAGRGARSPEQDGDPDPPRAASGSAGEAAGGPDATVTASAQLPELDQSSLVALGDVGRRWDGCMPAREIWERALPVDPGLDFDDPQRSRAGRFVHIRTAGAETTEDDELEATVKAGQSDSLTGRVAYALRRVLIGPPLRSTAIAEERMGRLARARRSFRLTRSPRWPTGPRR